MGHQVSYTVDSICKRPQLTQPTQLELHWIQRPRQVYDLSKSESGFCEVSRLRDHLKTERAEHFFEEQMAFKDKGNVVHICAEVFLKFAFMDCAEIKIHTPPQLELAKWFCASFARVLRRP
ncbi:hypothetical protein RYA99_12270 [Pseudomonas syringae pv. actinidifoliorum]|uniref:hypothetical protein n=1 Tax=Pseudomonas syringae TaxID=317 RepID=UPI001373778A|nr:hypothetical protein [Pseudomonas syringae]MDU8429163.1 hypothetical protein [Pseudomonas syringae pv. actinidifoliorum]MDU8520074.1 hypothetical protein [Pseudomonas syringae pv. actinidifoliorum]MDU8526949.1 hypothetical protein [Pseudomonas syringae pv. actinidifoliorum]NAS95009.1 hypothetical protein [Pseudomonas syringae pv. actinidifoliorum]NAT63889.1 hypothetical protein [Pseudomonas syringae pv. actinidifoliorum]